MIELYVRESCPYCVKVREFCCQNNIDFIYRSCEPGSPNREKLLELGGKHQVPFLHDPENNVTMYESADIINYLKDRQNSSK